MGNEHVRRSSLLVLGDGAVEILDGSAGELMEKTAVLEELEGRNTGHVVSILWSG